MLSRHTCLKEKEGQLNIIGARINFFVYVSVLRKLGESEGECQSLKDEIKKLKQEVDQLKTANSQKSAGAVYSILADQAKPPEHTMQIGDSVVITSTSRHSPTRSGF